MPTRRARAGQNVSPPDACWCRGPRRSSRHRRAALGRTARAAAGVGVDQRVAARVNILSRPLAGRGPATFSRRAARRTRTSVSAAWSRPALRHVRRPLGSAPGPPAPSICSSRRARAAGRRSASFSARYSWPGRRRATASSWAWRAWPDRRPGHRPGSALQSSATRQVGSAITRRRPGRGLVFPS